MRLPESPFIARNRRWYEQIHDAAMGSEGALPWSHPSDLIAQCIDLLEEEIAQREAHLVARAAARANYRGAPYVPPSVEVLQQRERTFRATEEMIKSLRTILSRYSVTGSVREWLRQPTSAVSSYRQQIVSARRAISQQGASYELDEWRQEFDPRNERKEEQIRSGIANRRATVALLHKMLEQYAQNPNLALDQLALPVPEQPAEQESPQFLGRTGGARSAPVGVPIFDESAILTNTAAFTSAGAATPGRTYVIGGDGEAEVVRGAAESDGGDSGEVLAAEQSPGPGVSAGPGGARGERHRWDPDDECFPVGAGPTEVAVDTPDAPLRAAPALSLRNILDATGAGYRSVLGRARTARSTDE